MDVRSVIEPELTAWTAAKRELAVAQRLAKDDPACPVHDARVERAMEVVRETFGVLRAAVGARGIRRDQLEAVLREA